MAALAPKAWEVLRGFPEELLPKEPVKLSELPKNRVRNRKLYRKYLTGVVGELLAILDLAWSSRPPIIDITLCQTAEVQLRILLNLPPGTEDLRHSILQRLEGGLAVEAKRGVRAGGGAPDGGPGAEGARPQV